MVTAIFVIPAASFIAKTGITVFNIFLFLIKFFEVINFKIVLLY
jgi:hypothetical protein